jgi:formylglycine-generating enzyme required for sulfatase activity
VSSGKPQPSLGNSQLAWQAIRAWCIAATLTTAWTGVLVHSLAQLDTQIDPARGVVVNPDAEAQTEAEMKPYREVIPGTDVSFEMVPIRGGTFLMGSPPNEPGRKEDEGPQHPITVEPFWMGKYEVTWDEYEIWMFSLDIARRKLTGTAPTLLDQKADAVSRPTKPYTDMTFGMGKKRCPAICMTQAAAKFYCEWLSAKTGRYYRLPTEAEWEYACRAGTTTAYSFGDDPALLDEYAWYFDNSDGRYHEVGKKKPNPWGLYDMHGNVAEWCLDQYIPNYYQQFPKDRPTKNPYAQPTKLEPRVVRGGSWDDDPEMLRSAARRGSSAEWKIQDPQLPQSMWYYTDALFVGFRIIRPLREPTPEEKKAYGPDRYQVWESNRE